MIYGVELHVVSLGIADWHRRCLLHAEERLKKNGRFSSFVSSVVLLGSFIRTSVFGLDVVQAQQQFSACAWTCPLLQVIDCYPVSAKVLYGALQVVGRLYCIKWSRDFFHNKRS